MSKRPPTGSRIPESRDFLWQALRRLRSATARELAAITERPKNAVQVDLRYLVRTGYVRVSGKSHTAIFTLIRDTGVRPPLFVMAAGRKLLTCAVDRNTHERFGVDGKPAPATATVGRKGRYGARGRAPKSPPRPQRKARAAYWQRGKGRGQA